MRERGISSGTDYGASPHQRLLNRIDWREHRKSRFGCGTRHIPTGDVENPADHVMHSERYSVSNETWEACQTAERVVAVGTTSVRTRIGCQESTGRTELFLRRGSEFKIVDQ